MDPTHRTGPGPEYQHSMRFRSQRRHIDFNTEAAPLYSDSRYSPAPAPLSNQRLVWTKWDTTKIVLRALSGSFSVMILAIVASGRHDLLLYSFVSVMILTWRGLEWIIFGLQKSSLIVPLVGLHPVIDLFVEITLWVGALFSTFTTGTAMEEKLKLKNGSEDSFHSSSTNVGFLICLLCLWFIHLVLFAGACVETAVWWKSKVITREYSTEHDSEFEADHLSVAAREGHVSEQTRAVMYFNEQYPSELTSVQLEPREMHADVLGPRELDV